MTEEHKHVWPKNGQGCYCGAMQCVAMVATEPTFFRMRPKPHRCENAVPSPADTHCNQHQENK